MASRHLLSSLLLSTPQRLLRRTILSSSPGSCVLPPRYSYCTTYKSSISLDKLYPHCSNDVNSAFSTLPPPPENEPTKFSGYIPMDKLEISYSRSSGAGGMNVNKVNTKATVKFLVTEATWIPDLIRQNFIHKFRNQITKEGAMIVQSDRTRYQHMNTADALQKLREMIRSCEPTEHVVNLEGEEKARKLRDKANRERLLVKRRRSSFKSDRGAV